MQWRGLVCVVAILIGPSVSQAVGVIEGERLVSLETIPGISQSSAGGINDYGEIIGDYEVSGVYYPFVWKPTQPNGSSGAMVNLGNGLLVDGINARGQIALGSKGGLAYVFNPSTANSTTGSTINIGLPAGATSFTPRGINSIGQICGNGPVNGVTHSFVWTPNQNNGTTGQFSDIGNIAQSIGPSITGINDYGQIIGITNDRLSNGSYVEHPFLWTPSTANGSFGSLVDLGDLASGQKSCVPHGINSRGDIVGQADDPQFGEDAFLWKANSPNSSSGSMQRIGGNYMTDAVAINDSEEVLGEWPAGTTTWSPTGDVAYLDIVEDFLPGDINNSGQIVGFNYDRASNTHADLVAPIPEPSTTAACTFAIAMLATHRRGRFAIHRSESCLCMN